MDPHRPQAARGISLKVSSGNRTALVIFVGITARRAQRRHLVSFFAARSGFDVYLPYIPFAAGLQACRRWVAAYLKLRVFNRGYLAIHFLNFIGGGYLFRSLGRTLEGQPVGRTIYVRSPVQEEIPRILARRYSRPGLTLLAGRMMADLSTDWIRALPFPRTGGEKGLIVETGISSLAHSLGLERSSVPDQAWATGTLLPDADDVLEVSASHDQIYEDDGVLAQAKAFFASGRFSRVSSGTAATSPRFGHAS